MVVHVRDGLRPCVCVCAFNIMPKFDLRWWRANNFRLLPLSLPQARSHRQRHAHTRPKKHMGSFASAVTREHTEYSIQRQKSSNKKPNRFGRWFFLLLFSFTLTVLNERSIRFVYCKFIVRVRERVRIFLLRCKSDWSHARCERYFCGVHDAIQLKSDLIQSIKTSDTKTEKNIEWIITEHSICLRIDGSWASDLPINIKTIRPPHSAILFNR